MCLKQTITKVLSEAGNIIEKLFITLSHWLVLQSFYEAQWWHFTDPRTIGVSMLGVLIFVFAFFSPAILLALKRVLEPMKKNIFFVFAVKILPSVLLFGASLTHFATYPMIRTCLLAIGVALSPLLFILALSDYKANGSLMKDVGEAECCVKFNQSPPFRSKAERPRSVPSSSKLQPSDEHSEAILLVAILMSMTIRWYFGTINVFYEAWQLSLALFICISICAVFTGVKKAKRKQPTFKFSNRKSTGSISTEFVLNVDLSGDDSNLRQNLYSSQTSSENLTSCNSDTTSNDSSLTSDNSLVFPKALHSCLLYSTSLLLGFAFGTMLVLCLWLFSTPNLLIRWSDGNPEDDGKYIFVMFSCAIAWTIYQNHVLDVIAQLFGSKSFKKQTVARIVSWSFPEISYLVMIIIFLVCGTLFVLKVVGDETTPRIGTYMLCVALPHCLSQNILKIKQSISFIANLNGPCMFSYIFPGLVALFSGIGILLSHLTFAMFVNPQLSSIFIGRMDIILSYHALIVIMSITITTALGKLLIMLDRTNRKVSSHSLSSLISTKFTRTPRPLLLGILTMCFALLGIASNGNVFYTQHCLQQHASAYQRIANVYENYNRSADNSFSVLSWNILLGHDIYGRDNLPCVGKVLELVKPDLIGLEESDALPLYWGGKDILSYLSSYLGIQSYPGVHPLLSSLGVGMLTARNVTNHQSYLLPVEDEEKLPHYSLVRVDCVVNNQSLTVFNVHAVYKNWTATSNNRCPYANLSAEQVDFIAKQTKNIGKQQPVIIMGDFNLNPNEPQLDILYNLGFKNALHKHRDLHPPSTLKTRFAIIDHIFYRGLNLTSSRTIVETDDISDHFPVIAYFQLPTEP